MKLVLASLFASGIWAASLKIGAIDAQGMAVRGTTVVARHRSTGKELRCETAADGRCELELTQLGSYLLSATTKELEGQLEFIASDDSASLTITLNPPILRSSITVVSGSRQEELQEDSPIKVEAISRAQMLSTGYERVSDVLQEIPGVLVRRGSIATVGGEQIQGVDSRQVLILQDGLPVLGARGIKSGAINLNRQTSDRLTRVEVAKGSGSALYGSDAIGGVINMITREPSAPMQGGFVASGGSLGMLDARGDIGGKYDRFSYFLNLGQNRLDSYGLLPNSVTTVGPQVLRNDILFKTRVQVLPNFSLGFSANAYHNREEGRNAGETGLVSGLTNDSTQSYALVADWVMNSSTTLQARGYAARYDENNLTTPIGGGASSPANLNERLKRLDATLSHQFGSTHFLQGGAEWAQNLYRGANRVVGDNVGQQITANDFWLQDKWTPIRKLTITAGGRITNHSLFGNAAVPKVGLIYKLSESLSLRAAFGMGFRAPDLGQLYFRFANPASFYQVIGNLRLTPEHSQSWQTGATLRRARYRAGVTLFQNNIRDLIDTRLIGTPRSADELNSLLAQYQIAPFFNPLPGRQTFVYFNQARVLTRGVELDGEYAVSRRIRVSGSYTFLNAKDRITQLALSQRHRHTGFLRADYLIPKYGISANVRGAFYSNWLLNPVAGTRGLPYQIWDVYITKKWQRGFETFCAIDNMLDSRDGKLQLPRPSFDRPDYGRTLRVGLRYRFGGGE